MKIGKKSHTKKGGHKKKSYGKSGMKSMTRAIVKAENPNLIQLNRQRKVFKFTRSNIASTTYEKIGALHTVTPNTNFIVQPVNAALNNVGLALMGFLLNDVASASEFTALFTRFRIRKIDVTFNMYDSLVNSNVQPDMYTFKVNDPTLIESGLNLALVDQVANVTKMQFSNEHRCFTKSFYPYTLNVSGGVAPASASLNDIQYGQWFDLQTVGTAAEPIYYGLGVVVTSLAGSTVGAVSFSYDAVYHIEVADVF